MFLFLNIVTQKIKYKLPLQLLIIIAKLYTTFATTNYHQMISFLHSHTKIKKSAPAHPRASAESIFYQ